MLLNLNIRVLLAGNTIAMVTDCAMELTPPCSAMIEKFFDTYDCASTDTEWL